MIQKIKDFATATWTWVQTNQVYAALFITLAVIIVLLLLIGQRVRSSNNRKRKKGKK